MTLCLVSRKEGLLMVLSVGITMGKDYVRARVGGSHPRLFCFLFFGGRGGSRFPLRMERGFRVDCRIPIEPFQVVL